MFVFIVIMVVHFVKKVNTNLIFYMGFDNSSLLFTPMVFTVTNPVYLKLPYGKRPDSGPITVLACGRAAQCTAQE